jgi:hypothetical protein
MANIPPENAVPMGFQVEVQQAEKQNQAAKLMLLRAEAQSAPWGALGVQFINQDQTLSKVWEKVIVFTGHRIDAADRESPRFPQANEPQARAALRQAVESQISQGTGPLLGISGGANGGDILFLEVCEELGVATEMMLALPQEQYIDLSVVGEDSGWLERFHTQMERHPDPPILARALALPPWLQFKSGYDIWRRDNAWLLSAALSHSPKRLILIALWDGKAGDATGGTEHMVNMAKRWGAHIVHLDTVKLFGLEAD